MKEIELKFNATKDFLTKMKGKEILQPRTEETTAMYDNSEEIMQTTDGRLRIRTGYKNSISYKKPITREGIKEEIEYESKVEDPKQLELIIKELGFNCVSSYTRFRTIWKYKKVKIFLDEFSFGNFVEIEGNKKDIISVSEDLGFDMKENITKPYDSIYNDICKIKGIEPSNHIK